MHATTVHALIEATKMTKQVMVDLETMSTKPNAAIISIGAQEFYMNGWKGNKFYANVSLESCMDLGLHVSASTILWWMQQSDSARKALLDNALPLKEALNQFNGFLGPDAVNLWGNGADFDNAILTSAYGAAGIKPAWRYSDNRCYKTFRALFGVGVEPPTDVGTAHNALDDAEFQVDYLHKMLGATA